MSFNISELIQSRTGENHMLYERHVNFQFAKVLKTICFDRVYTRAEGCSLFDIQGNEYLDMLSGWGVFNIGRNHPTAIQVIKEILDLKLPNLVQMDTPLLSGLLAQALVAHAPPGLDTVHFTNSGTETTEAALKFARCATKRTRIIYCQNGYHGLTCGSLSVMGSEFFRGGFGALLPGCVAIPFNDVTALERELKVGDVAAFITEPIQGGGVIIPDDGYLREAKRLCERYGTLMILDEIQTGLGRTGKFFSCEHWGVIPDMLLVSKSLSGGLVPVGALLLRREIFRKVFNRMERSIINASTFAENNLAMAAGLATLHVLDKEQLPERAALMGDLLMKELSNLTGQCELIKEVRGRGLMIAIEFGKPRSMKLMVGWKLVHALNQGLFAQMIVMPLLSKHNILTQVAGYNMDVVKLIPPLTISQTEVTRFVTALSSVLKEAEEFPGSLWDVGVKLAKQTMAS